MSEIMSGCPYLKFDTKKRCEVCELTGKPTGVTLTCDFDYDRDCKKYKKQIQKRKSKAKQ